MATFGCDTGVSLYFTTPSIVSLCRSAKPPVTTIHTQFNPTVYTDNEW